jgi:hypothetical protein
MKTRLLALLLFAGSSMYAASRFYFGVGFGGYAPVPRPVMVYAPPPAPVVAYMPPAPGPGYAWIPGYWHPEGRRRYVWRHGYWVRPPYVRARWVAPRYYGRYYYPGYWRR